MLVFNTAKKRRAGFPVKKKLRKTSRNYTTSVYALGIRIKEPKSEFYLRIPIDLKRLTSCIYKA
jgi:hypothetical protein